MYRVPIEMEITEPWIETARNHCKMKPERLAQLRTGDHARHWPRMVARRAARLAYFKKYGKVPPRWMGLLPGEPDHDRQLVGLHRYRKGGLAKLKAKLRKRPNATADKMVNRYLASKKIRSRARKIAVLDDLTARLTAQQEAKAGRLKLRDYDILKLSMLPDDALPRRFRRTKPEPQIGSGEEKSKKTRKGNNSLQFQELSQKIPALLTKNESSVAQVVAIRSMR
jgi:hypothetical protein